MANDDIVFQAVNGRYLICFCHDCTRRELPKLRRIEELQESCHWASCFQRLNVSPETVQEFIEHPVPHWFWQTSLTMFQSNRLRLCLNVHPSLRETTIGVNFGLIDEAIYGRLGRDWPRTPEGYLISESQFQKIPVGFWTAAFSAISDDAGQCLHLRVGVQPEDALL